MLQFVSRFGLALALLAMLVGLTTNTPVHAAPGLRVQVDQRGDFVLIGNTFGHECATNTPAPVVGAVGNCGFNAADSAPDIFWRSDSPADGQAEANANVRVAQARSTAVLTLPAGAQVTHAYLYWSAALNVPGSDDTATLDRPGAGGFTASITALAVLEGSNNSYRSVADVTALVQTNGPGAYRLSDVTMPNWVNLNNANVFGAWWMVVLYQLDTDPLRNLAIYDGLDFVASGVPQNITMSGFTVPAGPVGAKLGIVALDGDNPTSGDALTFNGSTLSDAQNPADNFFNGTRSYLGAAVSVSGDLPQLAGTPQSMSGIDLDVVDISPYLTAGQTSASIGASTTSDIFALATTVTSIETFQPEIAILGNNQVIAAGDASPSPADQTDFGSIVLGQAITRTFTISNSGDVDLLLTGSPVVSFTGPAAGDFSLVNPQPASPVISHTAVTFQVGFNPSLAGTRVATVTIANNDSNENPYDFAIQGAQALCFTEYTGDNSADFASADAQAVRDAIAAAPSGGAVKIAGYCAGVANEGGTTQVALITKNLTVAGGYTITNWTTPDSINNLTILDAQSAGRVISATADVTLQGFTITGGYRSDGSAGAGLYAGSGATLTNMVVSSNWITGSTKATSLGGGAYIAGTAAISGSTFMNNTAYDGGGGLYLGGANNWISNTSFSGNTAYNHGGGLRVTGASSTLEGVTFSNNQIYNGFGGGGAWASGAVAYVSNSQVISNTSRSNAGGLFFGDNVSITSTTFLSNTAIGTGAPGGGLYVDGTTQANSLTLINNSSGRRGGGATFSGPTYLSGSSFISNTATGSGKDDGGGGAYFINPTTYVTSTTFINNSATNKGGGAFFYDNTSSVNNTFSYNTATQGAGAWFDFPVSITNTLFTYNRATSNGGGAYFDGYGSSEMTVVNSLFAANVAGSNGAALYANNPKPLSLNHITIVSPTVASNQAIYIANGTATITNTIIASHTVGIQRAGGTVSEDYNLFSDVATPYGGAIVSGGNSITGTAAFFNMTAYTLTASSAAIDAGVNLGITSDYFGNARPQGLAPDMGYTESSFTVQEMAVLGNGLEIADSDASPSLTDGTDFGSVALGGAITRTFTISNSGIGNLSLTGSPLVTITGLAAADFSLVVSPTTPVAGNSATPFQVRFNPSLIGTRAATITIANTDRDENLYDFAIQGTGSNSTPIAQAGNDQNVTAGSLVALDGSLSSDPDNHLPLTYGWQQTGGSAVTLSSSTAVSPTFTAPNSSAVLTFSLTVTDSLGLADPSPDEVVITINTVKLYLPLVFNNAASGPDLVVESLKAGSNGLTLVVRNLGNAPVSDAFWVDVYFNPSQTPGLNKPWNTIASHGAVWGVSGLTLAPGQSLNLSSGGAYYVVNESSPSFPANAQVYALVDSINHSTSYGNVQESNEANNLTGPVVSTAESGASTAAALEPPSLVGLPQR